MKSKFSLKLLKSVFVFASTLAIAGGGWWAYRAYEAVDSPQRVSNLDVEPVEEPKPENTVVLTENKAEAAQVSTATVENRPLQNVQMITGRIRYNEATHVALKAPTSGTLIESYVKVGDQVEAGQTLASFHSQEIGNARADLLRREEELQLGERRLGWQTDISQNLAELLRRLETTKEIEEVEQEFQEKPLGDYRSVVLSAWLKKSLADALMKQAEPLSDSGAIRKRTMLERETEYRTAAAGYRAIKEQVSFDSRQKVDEAKIETHNARRRMEVSRQHLESLLGFGKDTTLKSSGSSLSQLEIRAPFSGTIESRPVAKSERVSTGETLIVLADTSTLYVAVDIREQDWPHVQFEVGQELQVSVPALPERSFTATAYYVGREVEPVSNAVPFIAKIDNSSGLLRPGMFVRVAVPLGEIRSVAAVPRQALLQHDGKEFVFVAENKLNFRRQDVKTGQMTQDWAEVRSGLTPGQRVVANGAFELKAELLLEGEE